MKNGELIQAKKLPVEERKRREAWLEYAWKAQQDTPNRLEDAAKFVATMISVTLTIFLSSGMHMFNAFKDAAWFLAVEVVFWLLSLIVSFFVLYPQKYKFNPDSVETIINMQKEIIRFKRSLLILSIILYLGSLLSLSVFLITRGFFNN